MIQFQRVLSSLIFAALIVWNHTASAADFLSRPIFLNRTFSVETNQTASELSNSQIAVKLWIFDEAIKNCNLNVQDLQGKISFLLSRENALWSTLDLIFPNSFEQVKNKNLKLVIDDFSSFAGNQPEFSSYYYQSSTTGRMIGIDCSSLVSQKYWLASLVHEFTHALFHDLDVESWWEEGVAQFLEEKIDGVQPMLTRGHFQKTTSIPNLLENSRPLPSRESYAISSLFVQYLKHAFGDIQLLRKMSEVGFNDSISQSKTFLDNLTFSTIEKTPILDSEKFTRAGLLRYFYVALTMNNPKVAKYSIPGWGGFKKTPDQSLEGKLNAGQAATISSIKLQSQLSKINPNLEVYRVIMSENGDYEILPRSKLNHPKKNLKPKLDFGLIINVSNESISILLH